MTDITETLAKPIGPLPLGGWILAVAGGVGVAVIVRRRSLASPDPATAAPDESLTISGGSAADGTLDNTQPGTGNMYQPNVYGDGTVDNVDRPSTNSEWRQRAVTVLSQNGINGAAANVALTNYVNGKVLTQPQTDMVAAAIRLVGAPPDSITPVTAVTARPPAARKPVDKPGPNVGTRRQYKTNTEWKNAALKYLRERRGVTRAKSHDAIYKYLGLAKGSLSTSEGAAVGAAIAALGPPPKTPPATVVKTQKAATRSSSTSTRRDNGS